MSTARATRPRSARALASAVATVAASAAATGLSAVLALAASPPAPAPSPVHMEAGNMRVERGPAGDVVYLTGGVKLTRDRTVITGAQGRFLRAQSTFFLDDNVVIVDSTTTITCDHASYDEAKDFATLDGHVVVRDRDGTLAGERGSYDRKNARAQLIGSVRGADRNQRISADTLIYLRDVQQVRARGNVVGVTTDSTGVDSGLVVRSRFMDFDRTTRWAIATGDPVLVSREKDGRETHVHALRLRLNTQTRVAEAIDSVRMVRDTLQARAERAVFDDQAQHGFLFGSPRAWDNETNVSGDTIEVFTERRALKRLLVRRHALVDYAGAKPGNIGEKSRLTGELIDVYFARDLIDSVVATGKAVNTYQAVAQPGKTAEHNRANGDSITIHFKGSKLDRAEVQGGAQGEYQLAVDVADTAAAKLEIVRYDALRIEYQVPNNRIVLDGRAHLAYRELELESERVEFNSEEESLVATGKPRLTDRGDEVTGGMMTYDLGSRTGTIYDANTTYEKGLYHGQRIRKAGEDLLEVLNGSYTTCNLTEPHFHFQSHWMKIYLKDKLVAKPVVFYVKNVPFFALPFYIFPIKPGRHSGLLLPQIELGYGNVTAGFIRNVGYYWAPNDYMDFTFSGDYYQADPSWVVRLESYYKLLYVLDGYFKGSFARSEKTLADEWDFQANHAQTLSDRSSLTAQGNFVSSRDYMQTPDFNRPLSQRVNRFLVSSLAYSHRADWASIALAGERRQDLDADQSLVTTPPPAVGTVASLPGLTQTLPRVSVLLPTRTIGSLPILRGSVLSKALSTLYLGMTGLYVDFHEQRAFVKDTLGGLGQGDLTRRGARVDGTLSDSRRLFGWLNLAPGLNGTGVVFDHDVQGHKNVFAGVWSLNVATSTTFYGTFNRAIGNLRGIRHVVVPSLSFNYSPDFPGLVQPNNTRRFQGFAGIDISGAQSKRLTFALDQRFQAKWRRKGETLRLDNLLSWSIFGSYNYLFREQGQLHPFSQLSSVVRVQPGGFFYGDIGWLHDLYNPHHVRTLSVNAGINLAGGGGITASNPELPMGIPGGGSPTPFALPWSVGLSYSYAGGRDVFEAWSITQRANLVTRVNLSPGWHVDYTSAYDITLRQFDSQEYTLVRDLHCWEARLSRRFTGSETEYYFRINVKDLPEVFFDRGTRGIGSIGGLY